MALMRCWPVPHAPPGAAKSRIAQQVATATNRQYVAVRAPRARVTSFRYRGAGVRSLISAATGRQAFRGDARRTSTCLRGRRRSVRHEVLVAQTLPNQPR